jgi:hypothetical protein
VTAAEADVFEKAEGFVNVLLECSVEGKKEEKG